MDTQYRKRQSGAVALLLCAALLVPLPLSLDKCESGVEHLPEVTSSPVLDTPNNMVMTTTTATCMETPSETTSETPTVAFSETPTHTPLETPSEAPSETSTAFASQSPTETPCPTTTELQSPNPSSGTTDTPDIMEPNPSTEQQPDTVLETTQEPPSPEETAPSCDQPDCLHVGIDDSGNWVSYCALGEWMLLHMDMTPEPTPTAAMLSSIDFLDTQTLDTDASLTGGDITFSNFQPVVLTGTKHLTTANGSIGTVVDTRSNDEGWNLSLTMTEFKECSGGSYVQAGKAIGSFVLLSVPPNVTALAEGSFADVQIDTLTPNTPFNTGTPVKLLTANPGAGANSYTISDFTITVEIPANTYAGTYRADVIVALSTGP